MFPTFYEHNYFIEISQGWQHMPTTPAIWEMEVGELLSKAGPRGKAQDPIWKITKAKRAKGMAHEMQGFQSKS
jgi:hypothetical protein